jgi:hypothetical protein
MRHKFRDDVGLTRTHLGKELSTWLVFSKYQHTRNYPNVRLYVLTYVVKRQNLIDALTSVKCELAEEFHRVLFNIRGVLSHSKFQTAVPNQAYIKACPVDVFSNHSVQILSTWLVAAMNFVGWGKPHHVGRLRESHGKITEFRFGRSPSILLKADDAVWRLTRPGGAVHSSSSALCNSSSSL